MTKISFSVSARTALLIGQQNFTNAEGAIIELVKNGYDADGKCCVVIFDVPYPDIPTPISKEDLEHSNIPEKIITCYTLADGLYSLEDKLSDEDLNEVTEFFLSQNSIFIIDNGEGMTSDTISNYWMTIGTGNKEKNYLSKEQRIRTGAKGIGRFALDRLGSLTNLWTKPQNHNNGYYWEMDWKQFDAPDSQLGEIKADLIALPSFSLQDKIDQEFGDFSFLKSLPNDTFESGTLIQIKNLRDRWFDRDIESVYKGLEALIPPKELMLPFKVFQGVKQNLKAYGEVETAFYNDYDYKIVANYDAITLNVKITITRNELDINVIDLNFKDIFKDAKEPYDLKTLKEKEYIYNKDINSILKWPKSVDNLEKLHKIGNFDFTFYFLKNTVSRKEEYPYKSFNSSERQNTLNRFGGIKIYRDSFRVRPYGDPGNDWLELGRRASKSPAGAGQRVGDWRVGSNQVAGIINISRINNDQIIDKSDRGALVENEFFNLFKRIITGIVYEFEYDRSRILNPFYLYAEKEKKRLEEERIQAEAEKLAEQIYQARKAEEERQKTEEDSTSSNAKEPSDDKDEKEKYRQLFEESFRQFNQQHDIKDAEIAQVRNLASLGLIMSSTAHELRGVKNNAASIKELETIYERVASIESKSTLDYKDGVNIIDLLKLDNEKIKHWVEYSLTAIKKDKRTRKSLNFDTYFETLKKDWKHPLKDRNIDFITNTIDKTYQFRAFEMDMNTIFSNLISNSIDSFNNVNKIINRKISIVQYLNNDHISITYSDNGAGLPNIFINKDDIFLAFTTSKKDRYGVDVGTGLGMYLVKNVVTDNNGTVEIIDVSEGFCLKIEFPIIKS